jgi:hypothetical protein
VSCDGSTKSVEQLGSDRANQKPALLHEVLPGISEAQEDEQDNEKDPN